MMFVSMVTNRAQIVVNALGTLPAYAKDRLLATSVAHGALMLHSSRGAVQYTQIIGAGTAIIGGSSIVPDDNNLLSGFKVAHSAHVTFATILRRKNVCELLLCTGDSERIEKESDRQRERERARRTYANHNAKIIIEAHLLPRCSRRDVGNQLTVC